MGRICKGTVSAICRLALIGACVPLISGCGAFGGAGDSGSGSTTTASGTALRPLPRDTICTQIYGGPQRARVKGTVDGSPVASGFSRSNGCEIHRWDSVRFLFPVRI